MDYILRPAAVTELAAIWEIILQAKAQMYREGKHQWDENYPTVPILENDVRRGWGYVLVPEKDTPVQNVYDEATPFFNDHTGTDNGTSRQDIIAYGAVVFDGEPAYKGLWDGQWLSEQPYVVLHRLAVADRWKRQGQLRQLLHAARLLPPRLHLLRPHPLRCRRAHGLRETAIDFVGFTTFAV